MTYSSSSSISSIGHNIKKFRLLPKRPRDIVIATNVLTCTRSVYKSNDKRAKIKLEINNVLGSSIKEVKSHF